MEVSQVDDVWARTKRLNFRDLGRLNSGAKTNRFRVYARRDGATIGEVRWDTKVSSYVFVGDSTKFNEDLTAFCKWATIKYRVSNPQRRMTFKERRARRIRNLLQKPDGGGLDKRYAPVV